MKQKLTVNYESDCNGWVARTSVSKYLNFFAWGRTPQDAKQRLIRKVEHYLYPTSAPESEEVEV